MSSLAFLTPVLGGVSVVVFAALLMAFAFDGLAIAINLAHQACVIIEGSPSVANSKRSSKPDRQHRLVALVT